MLESYDAPHSLPCVAPRPLLVANGELDLRCHMPGVLPAIEAARKVHAERQCAVRVLRCGFACSCSQRIALCPVWLAYGLCAMLTTHGVQYVILNSTRACRPLGERSVMLQLTSAPQLTACLLAAQAYDVAGCPENLQLYVEAGLGHSESPAMDAAVRQWLDTHLLQACWGP